MMPQSSVWWQQMPHSFMVQVVWYLSSLVTEVTVSWHEKPHSLYLRLKSTDSVQTRPLPDSAGTMVGDWWVTVSGYVCHVLTLVILLCLCFSMVRAWVGWVVYVSFSMIRFFCVWPGMVLNQRQLSIVVPDWEPYLGSLFSIVFRGWLFSVFCCVSAPARTVFGCRFIVFVQCSSSLLKDMDTYHAALWSSSPS